MAYKARPCSVCGDPFKPSRQTDTRHGTCRFPSIPVRIASSKEHAEAMRRFADADAKRGEYDNWAGRVFSDPRNDKKARSKEQSPLRVAVLDIEATALNASFGRVLCAVVQYYGPDEERIWRADDYEPWKRGQRSDDSELIRDILMGLEEADIVYAHNGLNYDMPFLRTRALINGLPPVHPMKIVDPVMLARRQFRFHSNRLDAIAKAMGTPNQKTDLDPNLWVRAWADGDKAAMDEIVYHCRQDVQTLADFAWGARKYIKAIDSIGSFRG